MANDERREIARRLREYPDPHFPTEQTTANAYRAVVECIYPDGEEPRSIRQILDRLAGLVDPDTQAPKGTADAEIGQCPAGCPGASVDREALLELAGNLDEASGSVGKNSAPSWMLSEAAKVIRKAIGKE